MKRVLFEAAGAGLGGPGVPVRNGLVAEYRFDECRNLLEYSQQFDNAAWTKARATVSANSTTAPDGTATADTLIEDATEGNTHAAASATFAVAGLHTYSIYVKANGRTRVRLQSYESADTGQAFFDLSTGTVDNILAGTAGASITSVGDGWYRCVLTHNHTAASTLYINLVTTGTTTSYNGDITKGVYLWGAQLEAGSAATTYVKTTDKQTLMDYSKPRKNLLLPNQANACEDGVATWFTKATAGDTVSASTTVAWQGTYSAKVICANAAASEGLKTTDAIYSLNPSSPYTASAYVYGSVAAETVKIGIEELTDAGVSVGVTYANLTLGASWQRVTVTRTFGATGRGAKIYVITQSQQACTMYIDGVQLEEGSTATAWEAPPNIGIVGSAIGNTTNDPTWTGDGQYLTTDDYNILPGGYSAFSLSQYTIMVVVNPDASDAAGEFLAKNTAAGSSAGRTGFFIGQSNAGAGNVHLYQFDSDAGGTLHSVFIAPATAATWQVFTGICNSTKLYLSKNAGSLTVGDTTMTAAAPNIVQPCVIGCYAHTLTANPFNGSIAYIAVWNRALTQAEITKNYAYLKSYLKKNRGIALP